MSVAEILHHKGQNVSTVRSIDTVEIAIRKLYEERIGALVVIDRWGKLAGMFSERDVIHALAQHGAAALQFEVHELMTPDVTTCTPEDRIDQVMEVMTAHRFRHMPVMDKGQLIGLVSIGDLVRHRLDEKEQEAAVLRDITRARH
ncbi:MAG TPA: CBS domain-containing protein [Stellaceae bacterium]|jgi:CBS domain-containing protein|nr:CBS domain-containing protein [Stellaceae bacterium]